MDWNIFKRKKREATLRVSSPSAEDLSPRAEEVRDPATALKVAAAYRCVRIVSETVARLPLELQRYNRVGGYYVNATRHPLWLLLSRQPNARMTAFLFMRQLVQQVLLLGNAYVYPRYAEGRLSELVLLTPGSVSVNPLGPVYTVMDLYGGVSGTFGPDELLHVRNLSLDNGLTGVSTVTFAARTLGIASMGDRETGTRFATGGKIKAVFHQETDGMKGFSSGAYDNREMSREADDIERRLNSGRNIIHVPGAGKLEPLSLTSTDMQFLESRKFTVTEIARFFGVPKQKVLDDSNANYKSAEMANIDFYADGLSPLMTQIEQEFGKLLPASVAGDYRMQFNLRNLYQTDLATRADIDAKELANGTKTVNELRRRDGLAPVEGGDRPLVSANLLPLASIGTPAGGTAGEGEENGASGATSGAVKEEE